MSDGETMEEAIANGREALRDCLDVFAESGRKVPKPEVAPAQWRQRLPRTLYCKLTKQAERGRYASMSWMSSNTQNECTCSQH